jgi:hypothetical protein
MSQDKKKTIKAALDRVLKPRGIKYTLRVSNHMAITCTITAAPIDFLANYKVKNAGKYQLIDGARFDHMSVNLYWINDHFSGQAAEILNQAAEALKAAGYYDNSDAMIDYFDTAYYMHLDIGRYDKPFKLLAA